ncbi:MAG TPA: serine hydrolase [Pyrinomonadaceae bacterium]|nr:serine hydrolase [Pyrinomonadaceae bacterium]
MNKRSRRATLALAVLLITFKLCHAQQVPDDRVSRVDALFANITREPGPGLAVAVVRDGKVILRKGYGLASIEHRVPITPATVFDVASVAKQFTGFVVATLAAEGKIKLSDDIRTYIPELPNMGHRMTIAHLVHHTSGIRDWPGALLVGGWRLDDAITFNQVLTIAYNQSELMFVPGAEHSYSNTNYNLLAEMIRRVTGRSLRKWTDEDLFGPLKMTNTHFREYYTELISNRAAGYAMGSDRKYHHMPNSLTAVGSSSLFSTVDDLALWMINMDQSTAAMSLAQTRGTLNDGKKIDYAFGVIHGQYRGLPILYHDGAWAGFGSLVVYFPGQKFGIALLANSSSINVGDAAMKIADIYMEKELAPAATQQDHDVPVVDVPISVLRDYVGLYRLAPGSYVRIRLDGTKLTAEATREKPIEMSATSEREFSMNGGKITFQRDAKGNIDSLEYQGKRARKVDEPQPAQLHEYDGEYESAELATSYRVASKTDSLEMHHRRHGTIPLTRLWRDDFGSHVAFMRSVEFQRNPDGRVTGFIVNSNDRNRNLRFVKRK